mgnify:CR=1 FL=1
MSDPNTPKPGGGGRLPAILIAMWLGLGLFVLYEVFTQGPTAMRFLLLAVAGLGIGLNLHRMRK